MHLSGRDGRLKPLARLMQRVPDAYAICGPWTLTFDLTAARRRTWKPSARGGLVRQSTSPCESRGSMTVAWSTGAWRHQVRPSPPHHHLVRTIHTKSSIDSDTPQQAVQALPSSVASLSSLAAGSLDFPHRIWPIMAPPPASTFDCETPRISPCSSAIFLHGPWSMHVACSPPCSRTARSPSLSRGGHPGMQHT
jgi:hypothetical protein